MRSSLEYGVYVIFRNIIQNSINYAKSIRRILISKNGGKRNIDFGFG